MFTLSIEGLRLKRHSHHLSIRAVILSTAKGPGFIAGWCKSLNSPSLHLTDHLYLLQRLQILHHHL